MFAGKECARALALMSTSESDCNDDVSDLPDEKKKILRDWQKKFLGKYRVVGALQGAAWDTDIHNEARDAMVRAANSESLHVPTGHNAPLVLAAAAVAVALTAFAIALLVARTGARSAESEL